MGERVYLIVVYTEIMLKSSKLTILHFTVMLIYNFKLTCCFNYFVFVGCYFNFVQDPWQHPQQVPLHLQMLLRELRQGRLDNVAGLKD